MKRIYTDRSRHNDFRRCPRLRYLAYHSGSAQRGLQPVRKSIHLVIGGAVHAGLEVLLLEAEAALGAYGSSTREDAIENLFSTRQDQLRAIEDAAVAAALADLRAATVHGVELDTLEIAGAQAAVQAMAGVQIDFSDPGSGGSMADSPIMIDFSDAPSSPMSFTEQLKASIELEGQKDDWSKPIYIDQKKKE